MDISFGIIIKPNTVAEAVSEAALAEGCGFDLLGFVDSQSVYRELYVTMAACAGATSRARLFPAVSNPVTRHPAVSASAIASIDDLAPGRTDFGIGSGDSAVLNLRERPSRLADMREYVQAVRQLLQRGAASYTGRELGMSWSATHPIPLYISAEGPKTLELAGEIADGVVINPGLEPELIQQALDHIATGARRADRDPAGIDVRLIARVNVCADREAGIREIAMELASSAHHVFRFTTEGKQVPTRLLDAVGRVQSQYVPAEHERNTGANARVVEREPELLDYLADRFAVVGSPEQCAERVVNMIGAGVSSILFTGFVTDRGTLIQALGTQVIPAVRRAVAAPA
jgi:5,10-methylenetetrahydromethanopterin reductase